MHGRRERADCACRALMCLRAVENGSQALSSTLDNASLRALLTPSLTHAVSLPRVVTPAAEQGHWGVPGRCGPGESRSPSPPSLYTPLPLVPPRCPSLCCVRVAGAGPLGAAPCDLWPACVGTPPLSACGVRRGATAPSLVRTSPVATRCPRWLPPASKTQEGSGVVFFSQ